VRASQGKRDRSERCRTVVDEAGGRELARGGGRTRALPARTGRLEEVGEEGRGGRSIDVAPGMCVDELAVFREQPDEIESG
jgi:hypothetical protein